MKRAKKVSKSERLNHTFALSFILPATFFAVSLILYPLYKTVVLSFQNVKFMGAVGKTDDTLTLNNYAKLFQNSVFFNALIRSILFTAIALSVSFLIGLGLALLLNRKYRFQKLARALLLLSWPIPGVVVSFLFMWMFDANYGIINIILKSLHIINGNVKWLISPTTAISTVIIETVWKSYPFFILTLLAGLKIIPADLFEAASIDGANALQKFSRITLPALRSVIVTSLLLNGLWVFSNFDLIYVLTGGGPNRATETMPLLLYNEAFKFYNISSASAIGIISLLVCSFFVILCIPALKKQFY